MPRAPLKQTTREETVAAGPLALRLAWTGDRLWSIDLLWSADARTAPEPTPGPSPAARRVAEALARYVDGEEPGWPDLPLDWARVSPFTREVLTTLAREVPLGATVSYGRLAALCGKPGAARAVGRALAANPWPLVLPCHRVLGSRGALTGFSNPAGVGLKAFLLELEGAGFAVRDGDGPAGGSRP